MATRFLDYPFQLDSAGRAATTGADDHVRDLIHQVLFTTPGERVNRPDFGCGLLQMAFMPNGDVLAGATQFLVQGALQRWLADLVEVDEVTVTADEERLTVTVVYTRLDDGRRRTETFTAPGLSPLPAPTPGG
jgi:phage baseplate assembly protein W